MELRELIKGYRKEHDLSQRQFADMCGLSNGYISMLERGINPSTQQPLVPSLPRLKRLADGMGMTVNDLFSLVDDIAVDVPELQKKELPVPAFEDGQNDPLDIELASLILHLSPADKLEAVRYLRYLAARKDD